MEQRQTWPFDHVLQDGCALPAESPGGEDSFGWLVQETARTAPGVESPQHPSIFIWVICGNGYNGQHLKHRGLQI